MHFGEYHSYVGISYCTDSKWASNLFWIWECLELGLLKRALHLGHFDPERWASSCSTSTCRWRPTGSKDEDEEPYLIDCVLLMLTNPKGLYITNTTTALSECHQANTFTRDWLAKSVHNDFDLLLRSEYRGGMKGLVPRVKSCISSL